MNRYINGKETLYEITENYPETIPQFIAQGFPQMGDENQRSSFGKQITLERALQFKGYNQDSFISLLEEAIHSSREGGDATLQQRPQFDLTAKALKITGLLPCPVRIPLLESYNRFAEGYSKKHSRPIEAELKAASVGTQWVADHIDCAKSIDDLPDLFISAGFDLFFDHNRIGKYRQKGAFQNLVSWSEFNSVFKSYNLNDPQDIYSIIAVVPAVFLVNSNELGDREMPQSWEDVLSPEFEGTISLPIGDFDLFNAILLSIAGKFGDEGIVRLAKSMLHSMHPAQMVKSERMKSARPVVTIMPYFFTKTVREGSVMKAVWPSDGAVLSPIFMLAKRDEAEALQPVVDFFASKEVGEILSKQGLFPSLHPDVDPPFGGEKPFLWLGWEEILSRDLNSEIARCEKIFNSAVSGGEK